MPWPARALLCLVLLRAASAQECGVNEELFEDECRTCLPGTYKSSSGTTVPCSSCVDANRSPEDNYCICNAGYYLNAYYQCYACDRGTYLPFQNTVQTTCYQCDADTYSQVLAATTCNACPEHSASPAGSSSGDACLCNAGYSQGVSTSLCSACQPGTYAPLTGSSICAPCPEDTYSTETAAISNTSCTPCPAHTKALAGSTSLGECTCLEGYGYAGGTCTLCEAGKHTPGGANQACEACEALDGYVLDIGWVPYDGVSCDANPRTCCASSARISNKRIYDFDEQDATSDDCASECKTQNAGYMEVYYSSPSFVYCGCYSSCIATNDCTPSCTTVQRHIYALANASMADCVACNAGTRAVYADDTADYKTCVACNEHETTIINANGQIVCDCVPGYGRADAECLECATGTYSDGSDGSDGSCVACPAGTYSTTTAATTADTCTACGAHETSPPGSALPDACVCQAGYAADGGDTCVACALGKYAPEDGTPSCLWCPDGTFAAFPAQAHCDACPANTTSDVHGTGNAGAFFRERCFCNAGFFNRADGTCTQCLAGTYKDRAGNFSCSACAVNTYSLAVGATDDSTCINCPAYSTAPAASDALGDCACVAGNFFNATANTCTECPLHSASPVGSISAANCTCVPGYTGGDNGQCVPCALGTYKSAPGNDACTACSDGKYSIATAATGEGVCLVEYDPGRTCPRSTDSVAYTDAQISTRMSKVPAGFSCHELGRGEVSTCLDIMFYLYGQSTFNTTQADAIALGLCSACACACTGSAERPWDLSKKTCRALQVQYLPENACPAGTFYNQSSTNTPCVACPRGTFQDRRGQTSCVACAANSSTSGAGSASIVECVCDRGHGREEVRYRDACSACAPGTYANASIEPRYEALGAGTCETSSPDETYVPHAVSAVPVASAAQCRGWCSTETLWTEPVDCIGYAFAPYPGAAGNTRCFLYFALEAGQTMPNLGMNWTHFVQAGGDIASHSSEGTAAPGEGCQRKSLACEACRPGHAQPEHGRAGSYPAL